MVFSKAFLYCAFVLATVYLTSVSAEEGGLFSLFPSIVPCNYTEQAGASCISCNQSLICFGNNIGLQWNCGGFTPNCIDGVCSARQQNCSYS